MELRSKELIIAVLVAVIPTIGNAQIPDYFEDGQMWRTDWSYSDGACAYYFENTIYVNGDTTIGPYQYKRLGIRGRTWQNSIWGGQGNCPAGTNYYDNFYHHVRQSNDSIFIHNWTLINDGLLLSYNMILGDTLFYNNYSPSYDIVQSIDTIVLNGVTRRQFNFDTLQSHYLIEGMVDVSSSGQSAPLFADLTGQNIGPLDVLCFSENNLTAWTNPNPWLQQDSCDYFIGVSIHDIPNTALAVSIHPKPTNGILTITVQDPISYSVRILDITGKRVLQERNIEQINLEKYPAGTYILEVIDASSTRVYRERFIVQ